MSVPGGLIRISLMTTCPRAEGTWTSKHDNPDVATKQRKIGTAHLSPLLIKQNTISRFSRCIGMPALSQWIALTNHTAAPCQRKPRFVVPASAGGDLRQPQGTLGFATFGRLKPGRRADSAKSPLNLVLKTPCKFEQKRGFGRL